MFCFYSTSSNDFLSLSLYISLFLCTEIDGLHTWGTISCFKPLPYICSTDVSSKVNLSSIQKAYDNMLFFKCPEGFMLVSGSCFMVSLCYLRTHSCIDVISSVIWHFAYLITFWLLYRIKTSEVLQFIWKANNNKDLNTILLRNGPTYLGSLTSLCGLIIKKISAQKKKLVRFSPNCTDCYLSRAKYTP